MTTNANADSKRNHGPQGIRFRVVALLLIAMFAFPAFAMGQGPTAEQYDPIPPPPHTTGGEGSGGGSAGDGFSGNVGPLPFTGFDVIAMLAVALAVTGVGLALQRAVARESTDEL